MNKLLEVYDNFVPEHIQDYIYNLITGKIPNSPFPLYATDSLSEGDIPDFGFNNEFNNQKQHKETILQVLYYLGTYRKINIQSIYINRVFFQLPKLKTFIPKAHVDLPFPHLVCLYYVNDSNGDTLFYNDDKKIVKRVSPKKGRIALFDGSLYHSSGQPNQNERIVINICFNGKFYE